LQRFNNCNFITSVDIVKAYWNIPIKKNDKKYTGFLFNNQTFVFNILPFGLAVSSFTRGMEKILGEKIIKFTIIYIDDFLIASSSFEEHLKHLDMLLNRLGEANFAINLEKKHIFAPLNYIFRSSANCRRNFATTMQDKTNSKLSRS
jgi:hypothetical protein